MIKQSGKTVLIVSILIIVIGLVSIIMLSRNNTNIVSGIPEVTAEDWTKGASGADKKATLIEYGDFQCSACAVYYPLIKQLEIDFPELQIAFRHLPLSIHQNAIPAGIAAEAAGRQDAFWQMHDILFERQAEWESVLDPENLFRSYAEEIGLSLDQFASDYKDESLEEKLVSERNKSISFGITATPTFFLNGEQVNNPNSYEAFSALVNQAIMENSSETETQQESE